MGTGLKSRLAALNLDRNDPFRLISESNKPSTPPDP